MASVIADRKMATVVNILKLEPIVGADLIELATINGWCCVVKKGDFNVGDKGIYICLDSVPDFNDPNFLFLKGKTSFIKTMKIRGELSQGLLGPMKWLDDRGHKSETFNVDDDVTEQMGVTKFVYDEELQQYSNNSTNIPFPHTVHKTDEDRLQNNLKYLSFILNRQIVVTRKEDGCSCTFVYQNGKFNVCGRNFLFPEVASGIEHYFFVKDKYDVEKKLTEYCQKTSRQLAIQGEVVGPKINGNKLKLNEYHFRVFNIFDVDSRTYLLHEETDLICAELQLDQVPVIYKGLSNDLTLGEDNFGNLMQDNDVLKTKTALLKFADTIEYSPQNVAEGIVVKTIDNGNKRVSFKIISNEFLLNKDKKKNK